MAQRHSADDLFEAAGEMQVAFRIEPSLISCPKPAAGIERFLIWVVPEMSPWLVTTKDACAAHEDFTFHSWSTFQMKESGAPI